MKPRPVLPSAVRTVRVVLTLHAAVRYRARAGAREPVLRIAAALPRSAILDGRELAVPGGRFRLAPRALAGEFTAATFVDGPPGGERGERVAVVWEGPTA